MTNKNLFLKANGTLDGCSPTCWRADIWVKEQASGKSPPWDAQFESLSTPPLFTTILMRTEGRGWEGEAESPGKTA